MLINMKLIHAVTVVESGSRALQFLGLDGENNSVGFDVRNHEALQNIMQIACLISVSALIVLYVHALLISLGAFPSRIQALKVNLIMTDYSMPGMTGYELLKKIKVET